MEDLSEFLGWVNLFLFSLVILLGLWLRFGKLREPRKMVALAHRIFTVLAIVSVFVHFLTVEDKPVVLVLLGIAAISVPLLTIILKRMKKLSLAINSKLVLVPLLAIGLFVGHLISDEGSEHESNVPRLEYDDDSD